MIEVRHPPQPAPPGPRSALTPRRSAPRRLALVATMPPGSGVESTITALAEELVAAGLGVETVARRAFLTVDEADQQRLRGGGFDGAVFVVGPSTTILGVSYAAAADLEATGMPTLLVVPDVLATQNSHESMRAAAPIRSLLLPRDAPLTSATMLERLLAPLTQAESAPEGEESATAPEAIVRGDADEIHEMFEQRGWTDGLPIVLPTPSRVEDMLGGTSRHGGDIVVSRLPPEGGAVHVEDVAVAAVMAGASPVHLPIILAAASLAGDPQFDAMTRSVNSFAFAQLVSGPYADVAGMTGGLGALSAGNRGNAVVGRSLGLLQRTAGGARLGESVSPVQGTVAARGMAFAEHAAESPWPAYHVDAGFGADETTVTMFSGGQTHLGNFYYDDLDAIAEAMTCVDLYAGALVLLSAKRAGELAARGMSRQDVAGRLQSTARIPLGRFRASGFYPLRSAAIARGDAGAWPSTYLDGPDDELVPAFAPGTVQVAVVGSALSSLAQVWFMRSHGTASVDAWR